MVRTLRIECPGTWHHVMNRGTLRRYILKNNGKRLAEIAERFGLAEFVRDVIGDRASSASMQRIMHQLYRTPGSLVDITDAAQHSKERSLIAARDNVFSDAAEYVNEHDSSASGYVSSFILNSLSETYATLKLAGDSKAPQDVRGVSRLLVLTSVFSSRVGVRTKPRLGQEELDAFETQFNKEFERLMSAKGKEKKYRGPVLSGVYDKRTGQTFFGKNEIILPQQLHPLLQNRLKNLLETTNLQKLRKLEGEKGTRWQDSEPGQHAEIFALNQALWAREKAGINIDLDELWMVNRWLTKSAGPAKRCGYCNPLTKGVNVLTD